MKNMKTQKCDICNCESSVFTKMIDSFGCEVSICDDSLCWKTFWKEGN